LQLESGEYFLKKSEKEAREDAKRKEKVRWLIACLSLEADVSTARRNNKTTTS